MYSTLCTHKYKFYVALVTLAYIAVTSLKNNYIIIIIYFIQTMYDMTSQGVNRNYDHEDAGR